MLVTHSGDSQLTASTAQLSDRQTSLLLFSLPLAALAGGMAWGIRGQYGHETGAMIFGILVGFVIVLLYLPHGSALQAARAIGLFTLAIGFGGSMTYGQTVGLTMDHGVHGNIADPHWNAAAYRWGMLGLAIKGGLWIGFGGLFLGVGLSTKRYSPREMLWLGIAMLALFFLGRWLINTPFDPEQRQLPVVYFSDHWQWEAAENVKPRRELWGGMLLALAGLFGFVAAIKRDRLAVNLGLWGIIGGLGFPIGQSIQAASNWDSETFMRTSWWHIGVNSWNRMEVTFGLIAGFSIALGCWLNRRKIAQLNAADDVSLSPTLEGWLIGSYFYVLLVGWYFASSIFGLVHQYGLLLGLLPMVAIVGGRYAPFLYVLPTVALSIVVKTYLAKFREADYVGSSIGLLFLVTIPMGMLIWLALYFARRSQAGWSARSFAGVGLPLTATLYFWLNFTFFSFPWGWFADWRGLLAQHQSGGIYVVGWLVLSVAGITAYFRRSPANKPLNDRTTR